MTVSRKSSGRVLASPPIYNLDALQDVLGRQIFTATFSVVTLAEVYSAFEDLEIEDQTDIRPVNLCNESLIAEFLASEQYGMQGVSAHGYETVMHRYQYELTPEEIKALKAVLLSGKIGVKVTSKPDYFNSLAMFTGMDIETVTQAVRTLEAEYGVLNGTNSLINI